MLVINCRNARREIQKLGQKQLRTNDHLDRMRSDPPLRGAEKTAEKGFHSGSAEAMKAVCAENMFRRLCNATHLEHAGKCQIPSMDASRASVPRSRPTLN